jgi:hypothetical protein
MLWAWDLPQCLGWAQDSGAAGTAPLGAPPPPAPGGRPGGGEAKGAASPAPSAGPHQGGTHAQGSWHRLEAAGPSSHRTEEAEAEDCWPKALGAVPCEANLPLMRLVTAPPRLGTWGEGDLGSWGEGPGPRGLGRPGAVPHDGGGGGGGWDGGGRKPGERAEAPGMSGGVGTGLSGGVGGGGVELLPSPGAGVADGGGRGWDGGAGAAGGGGALLLLLLASASMDDREHVVAAAMP